MALLAICLMGFSSISFASNSNTFTFTNSGIAILDESGSGYKVEGTSLTINEAGTYTITGSCSEGSIKVKKETTGVTLILKDLTLTSSTTAPISLNKSTETTIQVAGTVSLTDKEDISLEDTSEDFEGACIKVKAGATLNIKGTGTLNIDGSSCKNGIKGGATSKITIDGSVTFKINAANNGLAADGSMVINGGTFNVTAEDAIKCDYDDDDTESLGDLTINGGTFTIKASSDGVRANGKLEINGGKFDITAGEGLEATHVLINDGTINISASDDGINASDKSTRYSIKVEINGGNITIKMGQGDTDAIDSNGDIIVTGGTINITAQSAFDYDGKATYTGGTITVNGQKITSITNSMMDGGMQGGMNNQNGNQMTPLNMNNQNGGQMQPPEMNRQNGGQMQPSEMNGQNGGQMQPPEMNGQNGGQMQQPEVNGQNGGQMQPPEMNGQNGGQMQPPEMNGQNGGQMQPPEVNGQNGGLIQPQIPNESKKWSNASDWALEELDKADKKELIPQSFTNNDLTSYITREEFAHIIIKLYEALTGQKVADVTNNPFTDTNDSEVLKAYSLGITNGTSANTFTPNSLITREEMATMMTRAIDKAGINTSIQSQNSKFEDDADMHDWGRNAIYFMSNNEIIKGIGNNTFDVKGNATKEQALLISERSIERFSK